MPQRGRECQWRHSASPRSSLETLTQRWRSGWAIIDSISASVGLLGLGPAAQLDLRLAQTDDQGVANPLELAGVEHAGAAHGPDPPLDPLTREGGGEELAQLALERCDLAAEVVADESLGGDGRAPAPAGQDGGGKRHPGPNLLVVAKLRHRPGDSTLA